jgi:hypothetical protein
MKTIMVSTLVKGRLQPGKSMKDLLDSLTKSIRTSRDKDVELDFNGVTISDTITIDDNFKKLLVDDKYKAVRLKFYNESQIVKMSKLLLRLSKCDENKVENVSPVVTMAYQTADDVYQETKKSKRIKEKFLNQAIVVDDEHKCIVLYYHKTPDGTMIMNDMNTKDVVIAMRDAVLAKLTETGYSKAIIDFADMQLFTNRSEVIAAAMSNLFSSMSSKGYEMDFKLEKEEDRRLLEMTHEIPSMSTDSEEILEKIDNNLEVGSIGLLSEYVQKDSKVDKFGHYGNGQVATRQPAIYLGRDGEMLKFRVYDTHTFMRRIDWIVKQKEQEEQGITTLRQDKSFKLKYRDVEISLDSIGICKFCNGSRFYFSLAIQTKEDEFLETHYKNEDGTYGVVKVMLPKMIEMVLNEQNQEYNLKMLMLCVEETYKHLTSKGIEIEDLSLYDLNTI